jgi:hypothetical protein
VTVPAIEAKAGNVVLMAKCYWLIYRDTYLRRIGRIVQANDRQNRSGDQQWNRDQSRPKPRVRSRGKNLRHRPSNRGLHLGHGKIGTTLSIIALMVLHPFFDGISLRLVLAKSLSCFSDIDRSICFEAPLRLDFERFPRFAANAAPAAICCFFDLAGIFLFRWPT